MMPLLTQAAAMGDTIAHGPSWQTIALAVGGLLEAIVLWLLQQSWKDRQVIHDEVSLIRSQVVTLNTHVGVDGNGIIARLDSMAAKLDKIADELAESRGRRS
jgi:hypothetical protein